MNIAFYAPLKSPDAAAPSGDRLIGRMLRQALQDGGHTVEIASRLRAFDRDGDAARQRRIERIGQWIAGRLARRLGARKPADRPDLWLTYHLYHKAPDWLGPPVSCALAIPYCIAEASVSPKQAKGRWAAGHEATAAALETADLVVNLNPKDEPGIKPFLKSSASSVRLSPFIDGRVFRQARTQRAHHRSTIARETGLDPKDPWLIAVGMMRLGDKARSYALLVDALGQLGARRWQLIVVGDGAARQDVTEKVKAFGNRVHFAGQQDRPTVAALMAACDLFVWPAINEALGMVFIEAAAAGVPAIGAERPGVASIVDHGVTGLLPPEHDAALFADAIATLLDDPERRQRMGTAAFAKAFADHDIATQGPLLCRALEALVP